MEKFIFIKKENIMALLESLRDRYEIYLPLLDENAAVTDFERIEDLKHTGKTLNLEDKSKKSAKSVFFAPTENIFEFEYVKNVQSPDITDVKLKNYEDGGSSNTGSSAGNRKPALLFGLKPCDSIGIKCQDLVFMDENKKDVSYFRKRRGSVLVCIGCSLVFPDCFCMSVGGNPFDFSYCDIGLVDAGEFFILTHASQRKDVLELLKHADTYFEERELKTDDKKLIVGIAADSEKKQLSQLKKFEKEGIEKILENVFKNEKTWEKISQKCIGCAACTYVCPTCTCFDIGDELKDLKGSRYKCWDYCTNYNYTLEASGHNPRGKLFQRYRNKINCKFNYFVRRNRLLYCVGCGRCIEACPVGMDIREIIAEEITMK